MKLDELKREVSKYAKNKPKGEGILIVTEKGDEISFENCATNGAIFGFVIFWLKANPEAIKFIEKGISKLKAKEKIFK